MTEIDRGLDPRDGLAAFNRLYLAVTVAVAESLGAPTFQFPGWVRQLDVIFANLWHLEGLPRLRDDFVRTLDKFTGFAGRGLLGRTHLFGGRR